MNERARMEGNETTIKSNVKPGNVMSQFFNYNYKNQTNRADCVLYFSNYLKKNKICSRLFHMFEETLANNEIKKKYR